MGLGQAETRSQEFHSDLPYDGRGQTLGPSSSVFQGAELEMEQLRHELAPMWDAIIVGGSFILYAKAMAAKQDNLEQSTS